MAKFSSFPQAASEKLRYIIKKVDCHLCKLESIAKRLYKHTDEQPT